MKKYIVFAYQTYYPLGGLEDIQESFNTLEEAKEYTKKDSSYDFYDIVDRDTWEEVG